MDCLVPEYQNCRRITYSLADQSQYSRTPYAKHVENDELLVSKTEELESTGAIRIHHSSQSHLYWLLQW